MGEQARKQGWFKTATGAVAGLFSGAVLMYVSPLVDQVIKPAPPLANFDARADGLSVSFHNLSTGPANMRGWWDFGDGSALEPWVAGREFLTHTYPRPGDYTVRLTLRNSLGEVNERGVTLAIDGAAPKEPPRVVSLDVAPVTPEPYAPATFRVSGEVANAQLCVWDLDEGRPLQVSADPARRKERMVTFQRPGGYVIKLAAFNGTRHDQKSVIVNVLEPPTGALTALLTVTDAATRVERRQREYTFSAAFPSGLGSATYRFTSTAPASPGYTITEVRVPYRKVLQKGMRGKPAVQLDPAALGLPHARNLLLQRDADGKQARLTGDLVREPGKPMPGLGLPVVLVEERRRPASRPAVPVAAALMAPGSAQLALPPLPSNWVDARRQLRLEVRDGGRILWQGGSLPRGAEVRLRNRRYILTAAQFSDRVHVSLSEAGGTASLIP